MSANFSDENVLKYQVESINSNDTCIKVSRLYLDFQVHIRHFRKVKYYLDTSQEVRVSNTFAPKAEI